VLVELTETVPKLKLFGVTPTPASAGSGKNTKPITNNPTNRHTSRVLSISGQPSSFLFGSAVETERGTYLRAARVFNFHIHNTRREVLLLLVDGPDLGQVLSIYRMRSEPVLMVHGICNMIRRQCRKKSKQKVSGHKVDSVFNRCGIVFEAGIADAARMLESRKHEDSMKPV